MNLRTSLRPARVALAAAVALACAAAPAMAGAPAATPRPVAILAPLAPVPAPIVCGLVAFLDPDTGRLTGPIASFVPPVDQRDAADPVLLVEEPLPGGGWVIDLKGTLMESYVMHLDPLGHATVECVQDHRVAPVVTAVAGRGR